MRCLALAVPYLADCNRMFLSSCRIDHEFVFELAAHLLRLKDSVSRILSITVLIGMRQLLHVVVAPAVEVSRL